MQTKFEQLLDLLINEESEKANELFHEIVVEKSRDIYESIIAEEEKEDEEDKEDDKEEKEVEEGIEEQVAMEIGGDEADDFLGDIEVGDEEGEEGDMGSEFSDDEGEQGGEDMEDRVMDLEDALDELKAEFEALLADEDNEGEHDDMDFGDEDSDGDMDVNPEEEPAEENFMGESATLSKVAPVKHGDNGQNTKSIVAKPNNMGGTAFKLGAGGDEKGGVKGGLLKPTAKDINSGNINTANGTAKAGDAFKKHAVPKTTDSASNKQSVLIKNHNK